MMNTRTATRGALAGIAAGMMMAMWSMLALAATGKGFWAPIDLIAHTLWHGAPLDGSFSAGALLLGLMLHMMLSAGLGVAIVGTADRFADARTKVVIAFAATGAAWVGGLILWHAIDDTAASAFTGWIFAVGHVIFAMTVAAAAIAFAADRSRSAPATHRRTVRA